MVKILHVIKYPKNSENRQESDQYHYTLIHIFLRGSMAWWLLFHLLLEDEKTNMQTTEYEALARELYRQRAELLERVRANGS